MKIYSEMYYQLHFGTILKQFLFPGIFTNSFDFNCICHIGIMDYIGLIKYNYWTDLKYNTQWIQIFMHFKIQENGNIQKNVLLPDFE